MPDPRLAAVAVMGMLSAGVVAGSIASPTLAGLASEPLIVVERAIGGSSPTDTGSGARSASAGGGGGTSTITVTSPSPAPTVAQAPSVSTRAAPVTSPPSATNGSSGGSPALPPIKHMFVIVLTQHGFSQTFSPASHDAYLSKTLTKRGKLIENYYAVAASPLANGIALISGQGPTRQTALNCPVFAPIRPSRKGALEQVLGSGCVYPSGTPTIADQLSAKHRTWKAYVQDMGQPVRGKPVTCRHPRLGSPDPNQAPGPHQPYVTWRNPFVYFSSLSGTSQCTKNDVTLGSLAHDLKTTHSAPALAYIVPSPCDDGSEQPCTPGARAGLPAADGFLGSILSEIEHSAAYKDKGLIAITFDQAPQTGPHADASACCNNPAYPNLPASTGQGTLTPTPPNPAPTTTTSGSLPTPTTPTTTTSTSSTTTPTNTTSTSSATTPTTTPPSTGTGQTTSTGGGGQVGLLLISRYVKPGSLDVIDYFNHFSLLASIEKLFGLKRLGYASNLQLPTFDPSIFDDHP